jgi:hypothetical protein
MTPPIAWSSCAVCMSPRMSPRTRSGVAVRLTSGPHDTQGYPISQRKRKRVEETFGWLNTVGGMRKLRHRGLERVEWMFTFAVAAYNLVRLRDLAAP